jgi:hypothetical protein
MRQTRRLSLNAAATILAKRHGRAVETIRQVLRRHDRTGEPVFHEPGPLRQRDARAACRAWSRGVDLGPIARHFGKSRAAMHRAITLRRVARLCALEVTFVVLPTFAMPEAAGVILSPGPVSGGLLNLPPQTEATALLEWVRSQGAITEATEDALLAAWNFLKKRAASSIQEFEQDQEMERLPGSDAVDAVETDLRWAALLHRRLTMLALPATVRRIEANLGRSLLSQSSEQILAMLKLAVEVVGGRNGLPGSLAGVDPTRGQRIERVVAFDMERELAQRGITSTAARAAARHQPGTIPLPDLFSDIDPWMRWLDPWRGVRSLVPRVSEPSRVHLMKRFGWDGEPPRTLAGLAREMEVKPGVMARMVQKAIRELRLAVRANVP